MTDIDAVVGANLRAMRTDKGMSQADVARLMTERGHGWLQSTVAKQEGGSRSLRLAEAVDLSGVLGVHLEQLLTRFTDEDRGRALDRVLDAQARVSRLGTERARLDKRLRDAQGELEHVERELARALHDLTHAEAQYAMKVGGGVSDHATGGAEAVSQEEHGQPKSSRPSKATSAAVNKRGRRRDRPTSIFVKIDPSVKEGVSGKHPEAP